MNRIFPLYSKKIKKSLDKVKKNLYTIYTWYTKYVFSICYSFKITMGIDFKNPTPLYLQIVDDIKTKVATGELTVGEQLESHQELAREYGVSLITIKKALADLIKDGVLFSRVGKGTFVDRKSARIDLSKHKTIGLVLSDLKNPFFSLIIHSIEAKASEKSYNILLSNTSELIEKEESQIRHFLEIGVNGLVIASLTHNYSASDTIRNLKNENFPFVMISYIVDEDIYFVGTDHEKGAFMATEHLIKLGYKRIGYINGEEGNLLGELRKKGYIRALEQYEKKCSEHFIFQLPLKRNDYQSGYQIGEQFFKLTDRPDAMFVYKDLAALGFEQAVLDQGKKVPDDVAIVGFDNIEGSRYAPVPLTTIHQPTDEIGKLAVETLIRRIEGGETDIHTILAPKLVIRKSCGAKEKTYKQENMISF